MSTPTDFRKNWFIWRQANERLTKWAKALLRGRKYRVILTPEGTGGHAPDEKLIYANPQLFPDEEVEVQFRLTQGILAHECGHAWFTGNWPDQKDGALCSLVNALEDERIERGICVLYPGVEPAIRLLGDLLWRQIEPARGAPANEQALACCLIWRWAASRASEAEMFRRLDLTPPARRLWAEIRDRVEAAWVASDTDEVITLAREILAILRIDPGAEPGSRAPLDLGGIGKPGSHVPTSGATPRPLPGGPAEDSPGLGKDLEKSELPAPVPGCGLEPAAYLELEDRVRPRAGRLAEALKTPLPEARPLPHEWRGRYSFRQEARTPATPHLSPAAVEVAPRSLALYVLVDRSGSMAYFEEAVQEALLTIYLAAGEIGVPVGIACFGEDLEQPAASIAVEDVVAEIAPLSARAREETKSLIAGYSGWAANEFLDWGLRLAEDALRARPERLRVILVIHDGEPVFRSGPVTDWDLSVRRLREMERLGLIPIGIYLGESGSPQEGKLRKLFTRLVVSSGEHLPEKLGDLLRSLA